MPSPPIPAAPPIPTAPAAAPPSPPPIPTGSAAAAGSVAHAGRALLALALAPVCGEEGRAHSSEEVHKAIVREEQPRPEGEGADAGTPTTAASECSSEVGPDESEADAAVAWPFTKRTHFEFKETMFIFDWDDTLLPSTWLQRHGLRLDATSQLAPWHREKLLEVATFAAETLRLAKQHGVVIIVTNSERGWIEWSCQKFMPSLLPLIEGVKIVSARTAYECPACPTPLDWKLRAFEEEIAHAIGIDNVLSPSQRKNIHSLGDSMHEREALYRSIGALPGCRPKSLKFVERPDLSQMCRQHTLLTRCFDRIVHHDGALDLCINCD